MKTGYLMLFQNAHAGLSDAEMVRSEMRIAEQTEEFGFDIIWSAEHHFDHYSILPDNLQALSYLAGRTKKIQLGSGAVILPWNSPIRVAEKICMLDALCDGRFVFGIGRGLARREYEAFGIEMGEARGRFNEAAAMVLQALETGFIEGDGPFYKQKRTEIRPRPSRTFKDRTYGVAMSAESAPIIADLGATMMFFLQFSIENHMPGVQSYRDAFQKSQGRNAPPPLVIDVSYCDKDAGRAEEMGRKYIAGYYLSVLEHYEFLADYHKNTKGYEGYGAAAEILKAAGKEKALSDFVDVQAYGTPQQILDKLEKRRQILGDYEWNLMASFAGMSFADAESSLRLIGKEVLPEVKSWGSQLERPEVAHSGGILMSVEDNKKVVEKMMAAFTAGRMDEVLSSLSDSATWWVAGAFPLSGTKTKKEFADLVGGIADSVEGSIRLSPKAWTAEGDRVAVEVESYAKLKNGRVYNNFYHFLFEVRNGKIQKVKEYLDTMHANETFCV